MKINLKILLAGLAVIAVLLSITFIFMRYNNNSTKDNVLDSSELPYRLVYPEGWEVAVTSERVNDIYYFNTVLTASDGYSLSIQGKSVEKISTDDECITGGCEKIQTQLKNDNVLILNHKFMIARAKGFDFFETDENKLNQVLLGQIQKQTDLIDRTPISLEINLTEKDTISIFYNFPSEVDLKNLDQKMIQYLSESDRIIESIQLK